MRGKLDEWQLGQLTEMILSLGEALEILDSDRLYSGVRIKVRAALRRLELLLEDQEL